jgi:hypothetical protein
MGSGWIPAAPGFLGLTVSETFSAGSSLKSDKSLFKKKAFIAF